MAHCIALALFLGAHLDTGSDVDKYYKPWQGLAPIKHLCIQMFVVVVVFQNANISLSPSLSRSPFVGFSL